jgi:hypothetical protein
VNISLDERLNDPRTSGWLSADVITNLIEFVQRLNNFKVPKDNMSELLKDLFDVEVHSESFDTLLVLLMKFVVAEFIKTYTGDLRDIEASKIGSREKAVDFLVGSEYGEGLRVVGGYQLWQDFIDTIFNAISSILKVRVMYYVCSLTSKDINVTEYGSEKYVLDIEIMESPRGILSILYPKAIHDNILTYYDKTIDGKIVTDPTLIIQPTCCFRKYYGKAYYREMIRKHGQVTNKCAVCNMPLNKEAFNALKDMLSDQIAPKTIVIVLLVILFLFSVGFAIRRA